MYRVILIAVAALGGCAEIECEGEEGDFGLEVNCVGDDRPATIEYVTATVLAPNCANAQCHSSFANSYGYRFDTVEHFIQTATIAQPGLVAAGDSESSLLYLVLIRSSMNGNFPRMPYDQPLPAGDIFLIKRWIDEGADGLPVVTP
jgi:hypothetical protein